jgi:hypothetical protein
MLFWFQIVATLAGITAMDISRHTSMMHWQRYTSMAAPAICALVVAPLCLPATFPRYWKWIIPCAVLFSLISSAAAQYQVGPRMKEDFKFFAGKLNAAAGPRDLIVFYSSGNLWLIDLDHYHPNPHPVLFLDAPADAALLAKLAPYDGRLFLVGKDAPTDGPTFLPGWKPIRTFVNVEAKGVPSIGGSFAQMKLISDKLGGQSP